MRTWSLSGIVLLSCSSLGPVLAAESADGSPPAATERELPIEEIEIRGQRSLRALRFQVQEIELRMYGLYNALNRNNLFDVECVKGAREGSRTLVRRCEPRFVQRAREADVQELVNGGYMPRSDRALRQDFAYEYGLMEREMKLLEDSHPEFARVRANYERQRENLRQQERERGLFSWLFGRE